jgi:integrase
MGKKVKADSKLTKVDWRGAPRIRRIENKSGFSYEVDLGKLHKGGSASGRRRTYASLPEALRVCHEIRNEHAEHGTEAFRLTPEEKMDALRAMKACREMGFTSLSEAMEKLKPFACPRKGAITIAELKGRWMAFFAKKVAGGKRKPRAMLDLDKRTRALVMNFGDVLAQDVSPRALWSWLYDLSEERNWATITLRHEHQAISQLFVYARKLGYVGGNPLDAQEIEFEKEEALELPPKQPPRVFTPEEATVLLRTAHDQNKKRAMLGYVALLLFAGIRPIAEGGWIDWDDIDLTGGKLYVRPEKSKNRTSDRVVTLSKCALDWLNLHLGNSLVPKPLRTLEHRWQETRKDAGIADRSGTSISRHSFASYRYAIHQSQMKLVDELGHCDKSMLKHYRSLRKEITDAAPIYFGLSPAVVLGEGLIAKK